jgi:transposase
MQAITTIGLDIAKSVFQVHGVDAESKVVIRRQLKRRYVLAFFQKLPSCLVGIEACASSHHWSRELQALGHTVRLMPPAGTVTVTRWLGTEGPYSVPLWISSHTAATAFRASSSSRPSGSISASL